GTLIVSDETFQDLLRRPYGTSSTVPDVELGLVRLAPGASVDVVRQRLQALFSEGDVDVLTRSGLAWREKRFWLRSTPIGLTFGFGVLMGFVVGWVICYQILS